MKFALSKIRVNNLMEGSLAKSSTRLTIIENEEYFNQIELLFVKTTTKKTMAY